MSSFAACRFMPRESAISLTSRFSVVAEEFIGEIKVTTHLTLDEAFRLTLGQLPVYGHLRFNRLPGLTIFWIGCQTAGA